VPPGYSPAQDSSLLRAEAQRFHTIIKAFIGRGELLAAKAMPRFA